MAAKVHVGCCGFGGSMPSYYQEFDCVEVQNTFYEPPQLRTLERWRAQAPRKFEFTLKAWQLITHEASSPTYRRLKHELSEKQRKQCGAFRNTPIVRDAWNTTLECANALSAKRILFQCPASFKPAARNIENMREFFAHIERNDCILYFEPRGSAWTAEIVSELCSELDLLHAVDPFAAETVTTKETYFRLHGKTGWRYVYAEGELAQLAAMLPPRGTAYVFFNNITMRDDARRFKSLSDRFPTA